MTGFVAPQETVRDSARPERTVYAITDEGRHEVHDWLRTLLAQPRQEYPHFAVALSLLSLLPPDEAVEVLRRRSAALAGQIEETRTTVADARADGLAWIYLVEEEYSLALLEAERRFVADLIESLKQPDYARSWQETMGDRT
ncbi:PadR family transcriptional regulator [Verrucosispora sp. ts21]|uniref:PadR family transcriptional regulator n=1 Tax=Verrucosispora sp. ts21 TaxID=2069341 RepID=UPI000C88C2D5|nr:PadR family transcriptional regulator [Verrucosispora sp. ts21]PMR60729.1 PadR family transcriptional regulator [Verrucosispora sp. ts21]